MARKGLTAHDSTGYGFDSVRIRESMRTLLSPADSILNDSTLLMLDDEDTQSFLDRILKPKEPEKKQDTITIKELEKLLQVAKDTVKTGAERRKERREIRKAEREAKKAKP